jgi:DNA-binding IclR family transcriptional regulator
MTNYGDNKPGDDLVGDWLLGGDRKRRILEALAQCEPGIGRSAAELAQTLGCGETTAYEVLRALRPLAILESPGRGRWRLVDEHPLATALRALLTALSPYRGEVVDRPPRSARRN